MNHIFVEEPYGPEAIHFYEYVFGAKAMNNTSERIETSDKYKGTTRFVSTQLQFGTDCIILSERNPNSSLVSKSDFTGGSISVMELSLKNIDPVLTRAKKLGVVFEDRDIIIYRNWRLALLKDPYGIMWTVRSPLPGKSEETQEANQGDKIEEAEEVTIWEKEQQIYVKAPNGQHAINFIKTVFGAELNSNEHIVMDNENASSSLVSSELKFDHKSIIVTEVKVDHVSSLIDKNACSAFKAEDYIYLEVKNVIRAVYLAIRHGGFCDTVETDVGLLMKIVDPYGNIWLIRSPAKVDAAG